MDDPRLSGYISDKMDIFTFGWDGYTIGIDDRCNSTQLRQIADLMDANRNDKTTFE